MKKFADRFLAYTHRGKYILENRVVQIFSDIFGNGLPLVFQVMLRRLPNLLLCSKKQLQ